MRWRSRRPRLGDPLGGWGEAGLIRLGGETTVQQASDAGAVAAIELAGATTFADGDYKRI